MTKLIKLTDSGYTYKGLKWYVGVTHSKEPWESPELCTSDVLHAYECSLDLALILNYIHAAFVNIYAFEVEGEIVAQKWDKVGCFSLTVLCELLLPDWYINEKTRIRVYRLFAIKLAEWALPVWEKACPKFDTPRIAINQAKLSMTKNGHKDQEYSAYLASIYTIAEKDMILDENTLAAYYTVESAIKSIIRNELSDVARSTASALSFASKTHDWMNVSIFEQMLQEAIAAAS